MTGESNVFRLFGSKLLVDRDKILITARGKNWYYQLRTFLLQIVIFGACTIGMVSLWGLLPTLIEVFGGTFSGFFSNPFSLLPFLFVGALLGTTASNCEEFVFLPGTREVRFQHGMLGRRSVTNIGSFGEFKGLCFREVHVKPIHIPGQYNTGQGMPSGTWLCLENNEGKILPVFHAYEKFSWFPRKREFSHHELELLKDYINSSCGFEVQVETKLLKRNYPQDGIEFSLFS